MGYPDAVQPTLLFQAVAEQTTAINNGFQIIHVSDVVNVIHVRIPIAPSLQASIGLDVTVIGSC
jgi:hypothetical protein